MTNAELMQQQLRRLYFIFATPAAVAILTIELLRDFGGFEGIRLPESVSLEVPVFVLAAATGLALPILYRVIFVSVHRHNPHVSIEQLYRFEYNTTILAMLTPYSAVIASLFSFDAFYTTGIFLFTLYAAYFHYPAQRRVKAEMRIFRVRK